MPPGARTCSESRLLNSGICSPCSACSMTCARMPAMPKPRDSPVLCEIGFLVLPRRHRVIAMGSRESAPYPGWPAATRHRSGRRACRGCTLSSSTSSVTKKSRGGCKTGTLYVVALLATGQPALTMSGKGAARKHRACRQRLKSCLFPRRGMSGTMCLWWNGLPCTTWRTRVSSSRSFRRFAGPAHERGEHVRSLE
jgi:hypothetical protein